MITNLEPDILECKVKWALGSMTMNKANGGDGILVELFQILKDDAVKVLHSIHQQIWKTQQGSQDWKRSVFIPIPKKSNAKECTTTAQLQSSHTLAQRRQWHPHQYSCLENPLDGRAWWAAVNGVAKSQTRLTDFTFTFHFHALEEEMAATPVFLPGESQGRGSLVCCRLQGRTESDTTEET